MKKRIGCVLLASIMLLLGMTVFIGAESPTLALEAVEVSGEAGDTVTLAVCLTGNPGLTSLIVSLSYDPSLLTLKKAENGSLFEGWYQASPSLNTEPYRMVWVASSAQSATGELILLEFEISDTAAVGAVASLALDVTEAYCNGEKITGMTVQTAVNVICEHTYGEHVSVDASTHQQECSKCHQILPGLHRWDAGTVTRPETHLAVGVKTFTCTDCGETRTEEIPKDPTHAYGAWEKQDAEQHKRTCACGDVQHAAHAWDDGETTTPATHLAAGVKTFTCTDCGEARTEEIPKDPTHAYGAWEKQDAEQHKRTCACGDVQYAAHAWDDGTITTPATHFEIGTKIFSCRDCGLERAEEIPKVAILSPEGWILPTLIAVIVLCIGILILILVLKRRKKHPTSPSSPEPADPVSEPSVSGIEPTPENTEPITKEIQEETIEPSVEAPTEDSAEESAEPSGEAPTEDSAEESAELSGEAPSEAFAEASADESEEKPSAECTDIPTQEPIESSTDSDADGESVEDVPSDTGNASDEEEPPETPSAETTVPKDETDEITKQPKTPGEQEEIK